jgi:hypothetical protein
VPTVLWYAITKPTDRADWIIDATHDLRGSQWQARVVGDTSQGGLAGCGFLTAHLSADTQTTAAALVNDLASALASTRPGLPLA